VELIQSHPQPGTGPLRIEAPGLPVEITVQAAAKIDTLKHAASRSQP
jgi:hypothetical protein